MKRKYVLWILLAVFALLTAVACKSTPPKEETPPAATQDPNTLPPDQPTLDQLNNEAARAAAARKLVTDFGGPALFPSDWQSADSLYSQAEQQKNIATVKDTRDSTARYTSAADAMEALRDKTLAQYYNNKLKDLLYARNAAVGAGAEDLVPDFLLSADNTAVNADTKYQAKDYYGARDTAGQALSMYVTLKSGLDAYKVREEIANRGFEIYDPVNVANADDMLRSAASDYTAGNYSSAQAKCEKALVSYNTSLKTAWENYAAEKGAAASTMRQKALDLKANVAVRQDFNSAQATYVLANSAFQKKNMEEAAKLFGESQAMFTVAAQTALEKQQAAQAALNKANQKMVESDETAKNAEVILQGGN